MAYVFARAIVNTTDIIWLWNMSWETTAAMKKHLSWKTRFFWKKILHVHINVNEPVPKDHGLYCTSITLQLQSLMLSAQFTCNTTRAPKTSMLQWSNTDIPRLLQSTPLTSLPNQSYIRLDVVETIGRLALHNISRDMYIYISQYPTSPLSVGSWTKTFAF